VNALDLAREDPRVKGFVTVLNNGDLSLTHIYELRDAIKRFRQSGKFAYIYAPSYSDLGRGLSTYYLASSFDEIWMQPMGTLSLGGILIETPYARDMLDKLGISTEFEGRKEYKTVFESFTDSHMSKYSREMLEDMSLSLADFMLDEIVADRQIDKIYFKEQLMDKFGLLSAIEAQDEGLVDKLEYGDVLVRDINKKITGTEEPENSIFVSLGRYLHKKNKNRFDNPLENSGAPKVALVFLEGTLVSFDHTAGKAAMRDSMVSASDISAALFKAIDDKNIKVIVLRINSPGGSPVAAETVHRALERAKEKGKTVIVSMNWDSVEYGEMSDMWSINRPFSERAKDRFGYMLDLTYESFLERVANGRQMSKEQVENIAKGRVWTGRQALDNGLVDNIGGLADALDFAAVSLGKTSRQQINIKVLPEPKTPIEQIAELLEMQSRLSDFMHTQLYLFGLLEPYTGYLDYMAQSDDIYSLSPVRVH
jgi:protease-4